MTCECACHTGGTYKPTCTIDHGSSGVPGLPSCTPCDGESITDDGRQPCVYPGCDDPETIDGEIIHKPALTKNTICNPCRVKYSKLLFWIIGDYHQIKQPMPSPVRRPGDGSKHQSPKARSFGHPAEWASDATRMIADRFGALEDDLREFRNERPVHRRSKEAYRVSRSYDYIIKRFDDLCTFPLADDWAGMLVDMHSRLRSNLGLTRFGEKLPTPCPSCDSVTLVRSVGQIDCANPACKRTIREDQYPFLTRIVLDDVIDSYERKKRARMREEQIEIVRAAIAATYGDTNEATIVAVRVLADLEHVGVHKHDWRPDGTCTGCDSVLVVDDLASAG